MNAVATVVASLVLCIPAAASRHACQDDHVAVSYEGIEEVHAKAIARTVAAARQAAAQEFGFDMPETIRVSVTAGPDQRVRLFNDGKDYMRLSLRSQSDLRRPSATGIYHIYGLCHEVGHLAMYRSIRDHGWMTTAAAEGWAHYLGSRLVDRVHAARGETLWPDAYDYGADGMARLKRQLAADKPSQTAQTARMWMRLAEIVGDKNIPAVFAAWGKAKIDPADPAPGLREALLSTNKDDRLKAWWKDVEQLFVQKQPKSGFAAKSLPAGKLTGQPLELSHDDGQAAGKSSIAGGGHAVQFAAPGPEWYLTAVRMYVWPYGRPRPAGENFHVWLCDKDFKVIGGFPISFGRLGRGRKWVTVPVKPTSVPEAFIICVGFNPTQNQGVFMHYDAVGSGQSFTGLPGRGRKFTKGDWLMRVELDQPAVVDALRPVE